MPRDRVTVRHEGSQDKEAYERELAARPELKRWLIAGAEMADQLVAPRIRRRVVGRTAAEMDAFVAVMADSGLRGLRKGPLDEQPDETAVHFWRLGFIGASYEARDLALGLGAPVPNC